jgi:hypothetical protein
VLGARGQGGASLELERHGGDRESHFGWDRRLRCRTCLVPTPTLIADRIFAHTLHGYADGTAYFRATSGSPREGKSIKP